MSKIKCCLILFGALILMSSKISAQENCDNGIDDDGNVLIDLQDTVPCNCEIVFIDNLIPNPSFENYSTLPTTHATSGFATMDLLDDWQQLSGATSDYLNMLSYTGDPPGLGLPPYLLGPPPDGDGFIGFFNSGYTGVGVDYKEYVGACLLKPLKAGKTYHFLIHIGFTNNSPFTNISLYGRTSCNSSIFFPGTGCPAEVFKWSELGSTVVSGTPNTWDEFEFSVTPTEDIYGFAVGPDCNWPGIFVDHYYYADNIRLYEINKPKIVVTGSNCINDVVLTAEIDVPGTFQWYLDSVALVGETSNTLNISTNGYPTGNFTIRFIDTNNSCNYDNYFYETYPLVADFIIDTNVCSNEFINFNDASISESSIVSSYSWDMVDGNTYFGSSGSHYYGVSGIFNVNLTIVDDGGCKSSITKAIEILEIPIADFLIQENMVELGEPIEFVNQSSGFNTWLWNFGDGELDSIQLDPTHNYELGGNFNVNLIVNSDYCSDTASNIVNIFSKIRVYVPNAFSPNGDGLNDVFIPVTNATEDDQLQLMVFNKWGNVIFETTDISKSWDGTLDGYEVQNGIYIWKLIYNKNLGKTEEFTGRIALIK